MTKMVGPSGASDDRVEARKRELIEGWRCSPESFFSQVVCIKHPGRGRIHFEMRPEQASSLHVFMENKLTIVLKARQIGWTTLCAAYALWAALFISDTNILFLSRGERESKKILERVAYAYRHLPDWVKLACPLKQTNTLSSRVGNSQKIEFANGSTIESLPSKENAARGDSASIIIADEFAFLEDQEEAWSSMEPASDIGGKLIVVSTANGTGDHFHGLYFDVKSGKIEGKALFYSWNVVPERDDAWYQGKLLKLRSATKMAQEYPSNDVECFALSGSAFFSPEGFDIMETSDPIWVGEIDQAGDLVESISGRFSMWEPPLPDQGYCLGVDVAEGKANGDASVIQVLNREGVQVASWTGRMDVHEFHLVIAGIHRLYNRAVIGVERNNHGASVVKRLHAMVEVRGRLWIDPAKFGRRVRHHDYGWTTSTRTRKPMLDDLNEHLCELGVKVNSDSTRTELLNFRRWPTRGGQIKLEGRPHDDEVMALGIAAMMLGSIGAPRVEVFDEEDDDDNADNHWLRQQLESIYGPEVRGLDSVWR